MVQSHSEKESTREKQERNELTGSDVTEHMDKGLLEPSGIPSSSSSSSEAMHDEDDQSIGNLSNQIVLYDPKTNGSGQIDELAHVQRHSSLRLSNSNKALPSIGAFAVQCANCFKWRLIPTKEKYEELREHILEKPFFCETAREWRPEISCDDPTDISQDGSRLWAIDKPNIAQPPPGWQRLLHIRGEGSTKFADVYYQAPSGKRLRSMVEVQKYLIEHPEYMQAGVTPSQFSFQIPKPLQENYVRKRPAKISTKTPESTEAKPLASVSPDDPTELQLGRPTVSPPLSAASEFETLNEPPEKKVKPMPPNNNTNIDPVCDQPLVGTEDHLNQCRSAASDGL